MLSFKSKDTFGFWDSTGTVLSYMAYRYRSLIYNYVGKKKYLRQTKANLDRTHCLIRE
jgi:hypothetical protein